MVSHTRDRYITYKNAVDVPGAVGEDDCGSAPRRISLRTTARRLQVRPVLYKSSALEATAPGLAFRRHDSRRIAAAAAEADECREKFKAEQYAAAGIAEEDGDSEETACAKKYMRRLLLNRHSASASRLRKEAYCASLEKELATLEKEHVLLLEKCDRLEEVVRQCNLTMLSRNAMNRADKAVDTPSSNYVSPDFECASEVQDDLEGERSVENQQQQRSDASILALPQFISELAPFESSLLHFDRSQNEDQSHPPDFFL